MKDHWGYDNEKKPDIVEVVRCKDCKYSKEYSDKQLDCQWFYTLVFQNDFCSNGRKEK